MSSPGAGTEIWEFDDSDDVSVGSFHSFGLLEPSFPDIPPVIKPLTRKDVRMSLFLTCAERCKELWPGKDWREENLPKEVFDELKMVRDWWPEGFLRAEYGCVAGKKDGREMEWLPNGKVLQCGAWKDGERIGVHYAWWEEEGHGYHLDGEEEGDPGAVRGEIRVQADGSEGWLWWDANKQLRQLEMRVDGELHGKMRTWWPNGWKRSTECWRHGKRDGIQKMRDGWGQILTKEYWEGGMMMSRQFGDDWEQEDTYDYSPGEEEDEQEGEGDEQ